MPQVIRIIGDQGSGKSSLIVNLKLEGLHKVKQLSIHEGGTYSQGEIINLLIDNTQGLTTSNKSVLSSLSDLSITTHITITKVDGSSECTQSVMSELSDLDFHPTEWGGNTYVVPVSNTQRTNIDKVMENLLILHQLSKII